MIRNNDENKGLLWRLPEVKSKDLGKIGPAFGIGAGCGFGAGFGLFGGLGIGFPGVQFGLGAGAGCGIGLGFGYGIGKGVAYDESRKYSNVGKLFQGYGNFPSQDHIDALVDELVTNTKKFIKATSREIEKWR